MAATAALASAALSAMDMDENDLASSAENDLAERLAKAHIREGDSNNNTTDKGNTIQMNTSEESTFEDDDLPTPEGFFISNSKSNLNDAALQSSQGLPPWPTTPPTRTSLVNPSQSCPRPSSSSRNTYPRPLFVSSSSGALIPPTIEPLYERVSLEEDHNDDMLSCPASRAVAAMQALETTNSNSSNSSMMDISRQETFRTGHHSELLNNEQLDGNNNVKESKIPAIALSPRQTFPAYPSGANEPIPPTTDNTAIPSLYTFSPNCLSGKLLTILSKKFVPLHKQHTHGGSALAGFLALLLVTCANYMLGPMRDAAALAVGVSHIPALTLASTVLALGSSVPVGWLFEAPNPMRRRVWKRMGLTRGETQGTSLALFYRVFAFLLLSYALGFQLVDRFGKKKEGGADNIAGGADVGEESAIALIGTFFLRLLGLVGIPVTKIVSSLEQRSGGILGILGMQKLASSTRVYANESIPSLFLHACTCVVNKFGKVIYIMFFLVVHLMKLHSLSLIWGVTTEAMEYEETAEQRQSAMARSSSQSSSSSAGGLVMMGGGGSPGKGNGNDGKTNGKTQKPSRSSLRLKRLAFVGFGGTLGGILGSVIASFAAHILHLSGLLILAAILLEISANLSVELGRIMQRHWEEQMKYRSCGDLASLASAESLAAGGQQQQQASVDSSMRRTASLGSMKRVASGNFSNGNLANMASMKRVASGNHLSNGNLANLAGAASQQQPSGEGRRRSSLPEGTDGSGGSMTRARSIGSISLSSEDNTTNRQGVDQQQQQQPMIDDNSFKQRLLRGFTTILRSRLLMSIFTYNALYASTSVLLSFQRAELVANRSSIVSSAVVNTAFLAKINTASSVSVFVLQASGLGAFIANSCGQRGALAMMPIIRLCGVILLAWWHWTSGGKPPDLFFFLVIDEFTKVINFAIAKPVRENLWRGLSAEARYEAKPIVDTLANRWGGGSAAFLVSFINRITDVTGLGVVTENGGRSIFGFPPVLLLCMIISSWWTAVSADVGRIRQKIDLELKKQQ